MFSHQEVLVVLDASHTLKGFSFAQSFPFSIPAGADALVV